MTADTPEHRLTESTLPPAPPAGTVAFLFTDIEGSTALAQNFSDAWPALLARHDAIVRRAVAANQGFVFGTAGDAFFVAFATVEAALGAAVQAQRDLQREVWEPAPIAVRMGIHAGPAQPVLHEGRLEDYSGYLTLTRVQRVMSVAHGGQILLSSAAAELLPDTFLEDVTLRDMGAHRLPGLSNVEQLWQPLASDLRSDFPPLTTLTTVPNNLPAPLTSFVGRERDIAAVTERIAAHRLVTLTGPGGIGKTRLSLEVASTLLGHFQHGVWVVELAPVSDAGEVISAIARAFNLRETVGRTMVELVRDYVRDKELLLILDNFEQVIGAAMVVRELLAAAARLKVIVTSRIPLRITGEFEYRVPVLALPGPEQRLSLEQLGQLEAVRLFVARAQSARADFALNEENAQAIAEICLRLDGLPLAIELAAARVRLLPPQQMVPRLEDRLKFLTSSARDLPERQRTLRAAIDWSYDLLSDSEKRLFQRLAVFRGGATLEAIEQVCGDGESDLLTELESLLDQSLLNQIEQNGEVRFRLLETIREYAEEALNASVEGEQIRQRHLDYFYELSILSQSALFGPDELEWMVRLTGEVDNFRAAVRWGLEHNLGKGVRLLCDLSHFWSRGGYNDEAIGWLKLALERVAAAESEMTPSERLSLQARIMPVLGILSLQRGYPEAEAILRESIPLLEQTGEERELAIALSFVGFVGDMEAAHKSVAIARRLGDKSLLAYALTWLSQSMRVTEDDLQVARSAAAEGARLSREIGSAWSLARALLSQGQLAVLSGEISAAREYLQESMTLFAESQDEYHAAMAQTDLAHLERWQGNYAEAERHYQATIMVWQDWGLQAAVARQLECLTLVAVAQGALERAARLAGAVEKLRAEIDSEPGPKEQSKYIGAIEALRNQLGVERFEALVAEGRMMSGAEAVAYAVAVDGSLATYGRNQV